MTRNRSGLGESQEQQRRSSSVAPFLARFAILAAANGASESTKITRVDRETHDDQ